MGKGGVLIVSNRLPVNITDLGGHLVFERSIGGMASALGSVAKQIGARWVGWSGLPRILPIEELIDAGMPKEFIPVQAEAELIKGYYDRFSNSLLWPAFHSRRSSFVPSDADWAAYQGMNRRFADAVISAVQPGEIVWINDYHLMLLPLYLRQAGLTNPIGYFLHVPLPPRRFLRALPYGRELLEGISGADVLGFQTQRDVDNYMHYIGKSRQEHVPRLIKAFPIGTDYQAYNSAASNPSVKKIKDSISKQTKGKKIIFSMSRLDYTKGILTQLKAVEKFLKKRLDREKMVYKLVVAPSREQLAEYANLKAKIKQLCMQINDRLGNERWQPISHEDKSINFEKTVAWYGMADVLLLLPDVDGMNLVAKEYIAARRGSKGMLVLSTGMGAAEQLNNALLVPPKNVTAAAEAIQQALEMPPEERTKRWRKMRAKIRRQDVFWWADSFLSALAVRS